MELGTLKAFIVDELEPARGQRGKYICPLCGSGQGANKTAAFSIKGEHGHCFACGWHGDIYDLVAARDHLSLQDATRWVKEKYGGVDAAPIRRSAEPLPARDLRAEVEAYHAAIAGSQGEAYLLGRGISQESIRRFKLGYDSQRKRVTIPYDRAGSYYGMRNIDPAADHAHDKPKGVPAPLFNAAALCGDAPCFVVESPLCAISIMQECPTVAAVALGGCNIRLLQGKRISARLILALDNDEPGRKAQAQLSAWLDEQGVQYAEGNVSGDYKDPNEALQRDQEAFRKRVEDVASGTDEAMQRGETAAREAYQQSSAAGIMDSFLTAVSNSASHPPVPTGFVGLDKLLDGGLYDGLYTLGAVSSLGKTSFVLQMCDQITAAGHDVLYVALEMSRDELIAKSVSRYTYDIVQEQELDRGVAKTTRGILSGVRYARYNELEMQTIAAAVDRYTRNNAHHMWIIEGMGSVGVEDIRKRVEEHIRLTGHRPVVVVDYLQLLAPQDVHASDKQNTDRNVLELKRITRDMSMPVVAISSLNRDNYTEPINTAAFKESGAIEYGSDCLIGLQYAGMDYQQGDGKESRVKRIRELINENDGKARRGEGVSIDIKVLKNRNGAKGYSDPIEYTPMFNMFKEHPVGWTIVHDEPRRRL